MKTPKDLIHRAVALRFDGLEFDAIASVVGRHERTVRGWQDTDIWRDELARLRIESSELRRREITEKMESYRQQLEDIADRNLAIAMSLEQSIEKKLNSFKLEEKDSYSLGDLAKLCSISTTVSRAIQSSYSILSEVSGVNDVLDYLAERDAKMS